MKTITTVILILACLNSLAPAQEDPLRKHLFPPELIMQNQRALGLSSEQRQYFIDEIHAAQKTFLQIEWQLQEEAQKMSELFEADSVSEQEVLAQLERVLELEKEIKTAQLTLVVRLRNQLSAEQRAKLQEIKSQKNLR